MKKRILICSGIFMLLLLGCAAVYLARPAQGGGFLPCILYLFTGFYCPGCGTGRAVDSLLHLHFYKAFRFNPMFVLLLPWILAYLAAIAIAYIRWGTSGFGRVHRRIPPQPLWVILILVFIYGALRNLPFFPFNLLAPTAV